MAKDEEVKPDPQPTVTDTKVEEVDSGHEERQADMQAFSEQEETIYNMMLTTIFKIFRVERIYLKMAGQVKADGTAGVPFYGKLYSQKTATGTYKITHNFHTLNYSVQLTPLASTAKEVCLTAKTEDYCTYKVFDSSNAAEDNIVEVLLMLF